MTLDTLCPLHNDLKWFGLRAGLMIRSMRRRNARRRSWLQKRSVAALASIFAIGGSLGVARASGAAQQWSDSASTAVSLADPDTFNWNGVDYTFGTTELYTSACGSSLGTYYVPFVSAVPTSSGSNVGQKCYSGDAMPFGPGLWASASSDIWAPSVEYIDGSFFIYYSALKNGTGQRCVGIATSTNVTGPYKSQSEWSCPTGGRWAIDADPFRNGAQTYVAFRDDGIVSGGATGISIVRAGAGGFADWPSRRDSLKSIDVGWNTTACDPGNLIENPSVWLDPDGNYYESFSTGCWKQSSPVSSSAPAPYATGIAICGANPLPATRCKVLGGGSRPMFAQTNSGLNPIYALPGDHVSPGGMSVYKSNGTQRVSWHWLNAANGTNSRFTRTGSLLHSGSAWKVN